ncbi:hypothetical protein [Catenuloplanes atrovinosus]|uniref:Lipoprotein n=1 Tax=Catenuloplanes atrovinosus TaxID=137266 RepID=A0AAE3YLH8_9ACTN|nr:hypothetical protein [Catenuloplanes atrovinosus]MDR7276034.1 hypothetical protein [Catenuloplanes atrovinosus]
MGTRVLSTLAAILLTGTGCTVTVDNAPPRPTASAVPGSVVLDTTIPGWTVEAWLTDSSGFCVRAIDPRRFEQGSACRGLGALAEDGPPALGGKPAPQMTPHDYDRDRMLMVGTVRGEIAEVTVTMSGHAATGAVVPLTASRVGAYAVWLPAGDGVGSDHITGVVGYAADGTLMTVLR